MNNQPSNKKISDIVLKRIETEKPLQHSRRYFAARNVAIWCLAALALIVGALAVSSIIFRLHNAFRVLPPQPEELRMIGSLLAVLPLLWIGILIVFGYFALKEIRSTRQGYRYELSTLLLGMIVISVTLGAMFYHFGSGYVLDRFASRAVPFHQDLEELERRRWLNPQEGFLIGEIASSSDGGSTLIDPEDKTWTVVFAEDLASEDRALARAGERVGIRGQLISFEERTFSACDIRPLSIRGRGRFAPPPRRSNQDPMFMPHLQSGVNERTSNEVRSTKCEGRTTSAQSSQNQ